jgi:predicted oxidoreductase
LIWHNILTTNKGETIPDLYAIGNIADSWESQIYCGELCESVFGFAINSGGAAGENVAEYLSSMPVKEGG